MIPEVSFDREHSMVVMDTGKDVVRFNEKEFEEFMTQLNLKGSNNYATLHYDNKVRLIKEYLSEHVEGGCEDIIDYVVESGEKTSMMGIWIMLGQLVSDGVLEDRKDADSVRVYRLKKKED